VLGAKRASLGLEHMFQNTIQRTVSTEGVGLHTGVFGHVSLVPAPADTGVVFRRTDLDNFAIEAPIPLDAPVTNATLDSGMSRILACSILSRNG